MRLLVICWFVQASLAKVAPSEDFDWLGSTGHSGGIDALCISPDQRYLASGSDDHTAKLWDFKTGELVVEFKAHSGWVMSVDISPDGELFATASQDKTVRLWSLADGIEKQRIGGLSDWVTCVRFAADGNSLLVGLQDGGLHQYDLDGQRLRSFKGHNRSVEEMVIMSESRFATGSGEGVVSVWNIATGEQEMFTAEHRDGVQAIVWNDERQQLLTVGLDRSIKEWLPPNPASIEEHRFPMKLLKAAALTASGQYMYAGKNEGVLAQWDVKNSKLVREKKLHTDNVTAIAISPDQRYVATGSRDGSIAVSSLELEDQPRQKSLSPTEIASMSINAQSGTVLIGCEDGILRVLKKDRERPTFLEGHEPGIKITTVDFTSNGSMGVSASLDGTLRRWDLSDPTESDVIADVNNWITGFAVSSDAKLIACKEFGKSPYILDAQNGARLETPPSGLGRNGALHFLHGSKYLFSGFQLGGLQVLNIPEDRVVQRYQGHRLFVRSIDIDKKQQILVTGSDDATARVWAINTGKANQVLRGHRKPILSVAITADGLLALTGSEDKTARLWETQSGELIHRFEGHQDSVNAVGFLADETLVVTASSDGDLKFWKVDSGKLVGLMRFFANGEDWFLMVGDSRYDGSEEVVKRVSANQGTGAKASSEKTSLPIRVEGLLSSLLNGDL